MKSWEEGVSVNVSVSDIRHIHTNTHIPASRHSKCAVPPCPSPCRTASLQRTHPASSSIIEVTIIVEVSGRESVVEKARGDV